MATPTNNYNTVIGSPVTPAIPVATVANTTSSIQPPPPINIEDFQLFPLVLDIISRIKDDEIDLIRAINLANETRIKTLDTISKLPGINRSLEEQEKLLKSYKLTLKKKEELLEKLKKLEIFEKYNQLKVNTQQEQQTAAADDNNDTTTDNTTTTETTTTTTKTDDDIMKE